MDNTLIEGLRDALWRMKLATMKRWEQEKCEHCGERLETLFDRNNRNPIRICGRCETMDREDD